MKKLLATAALAALSFLVAPKAEAGVGMTANLGGWTDGTYWLPSIDYRAKGLLVQVHALDLINGIKGGGFALNTGADVTYVVVKKQIAPEIEGVLMPGAGIRVVDQGDIGFNFMAQARMGMEMKKGMGFGVYVVPGLGISNIGTGDIGVATGGGVQISSWFPN